MARLLVCSFSLLLIPASGLAQDCRDATGEPVPCSAAAPTTITATVSSYSAPSPSIPAPAPDVATEAHARGDEPMAYFGFGLGFEVIRPAALAFTQTEAGRAPELARGALLTGASEVFVLTPQFVLGYRPLPWLRVPELRLSIGGGDYEREGASWSDGIQPAIAPPRGAALGTVFLLRAEVAGGFEIPIDDISIFAMGHIAIAAYFVEAELTHDTAGSLGVAGLAEDAWEAGWTVGISGHLGGGIRLEAAYRHVHTGAEADSIRFGLTADVE